MKITKMKINVVKNEANSGSNEHHHHNHHHCHHHKHNEDEQAPMLQHDDFDSREFALEWANDPLPIFFNEKLADIVVNRHLLKLGSDKISVLDFGCGAGNLTKIIKEKCNNKPKITGIDSAAAMIEVYKERFLDCDAYCLDLIKEKQDILAEKQFDYIFVFYVLHHCSDPLKMIQVLSSYVAPNGTIILGEFAPEDRSKALGEFFYGGDLTRWLNEAGFKNIVEQVAFDCENEKLPESKLLEKTNHGNDWNPGLVIFGEGVKI